MLRYRRQAHSFTEYDFRIDAILGRTMLMAPSVFLSGRVTLRPIKLTLRFMAVKSKLSPLGSE